MARRSPKHDRVWFVGFGGVYNAGYAVVFANTADVAKEIVRERFNKQEPELRISNNAKMTVQYVGLLASGSHKPYISVYYNGA